VKNVDIKTQKLTMLIIRGRMEINMITYKNISNSSVKVYLGKRVAGTIVKRSDNLWQYFPKGCKEGGKPYTTLGACKMSLEG